MPNTGCAAIFRALIRRQHRVPRTFRLAVPPPDKAIYDHFRPRKLARQGAYFTMKDRSSRTPTLASPHRLSAGKYLALATLAGVGLVGLWYSAKSDLDLSLDTGKLNEPHKLMIYAHGDRGIEQWVNAQVLTSGAYPFRVDPSPVTFEAKRATQGQVSSLDAMLEHADELGFGYIAIDLQGPGSEGWRNQLQAAAPELEINQEDRWAVIRSDRRSDTLKVHVGKTQGGVQSSQQASARASLMQALFLAPDLFKLSQKEQALDLQTLPIARSGVQLARLAWREFPFAKLSQLTIEQWPTQLSDAPTETNRNLWIAEPMQQVRAEPLSETAILLKTAALEWSNPQGSKIALRSTAARQGWTYDVAIRGSRGLRKIHCEGISGVRALASKSSLDGQVIELVRNDNGHQVFSISISPDGECETELLSQTPASSEALTLGLPDLSGKSSWLAARQDQQTLVWRLNSRTGKIKLPDRQFVRERWQWQRDGSLLALTKAKAAKPRGMSELIANATPPPAFALEKIRIDPQAPQGLQRETVTEFSSLKDAAAHFVAPELWPEVQHTEERRFGTNLRQATFSPALTRFGASSQD